MKQKILSMVLIIVLVASMPMTAMAQEQTTIPPWFQSGVDLLVSKGMIQQHADPTATVSVSDFIRYAVTALTFQHGVDPMKVAIAEGWVLKDEFTDTNVSIKRGESARILVRAFDQGQSDMGLVEYAKRAKALGLIQGDLNGQLREQKIATLGEVASMLQHYKQISLSKHDNKDVPQISVEDFMRKSGSRNYKLSADGTSIAYLAPWERRDNVYVQKLDNSSEPIRVSNSRDRDIDSFTWKDDCILYQKDKDGDENFHIYSATINGHEEKDLTPYDKVTANIISILPGEKDHILIGMDKEDATNKYVYKLNLKSGNTERMMKHDTAVLRWIADDEGKLRLMVAADGIYYRNTEEEPFQPFFTVPFDHANIIPIRLSHDQQKIYARSNKDRDKQALVTFDRQGTEELVYSHPDVDVSGGVDFGERDKLLRVSFETDKGHRKFFDDQEETLYKKIQHKLNVSESEFIISSKNEDKTKFIILTTNDKIPGKYYYYNSRTDQLTLLSHLSSGLKPENMADMHPISYKSRDGLIIHGYLTLPKNKTPEQLPLVVFPHGGPYTRNSWGFQDEVQLLANRGYAVLQVNFRSSTGYGQAFIKAGYKEWGGKVQDDITDAVQWTIKQGITDSKRIAIYGASFGGYTALAGISFTPHLYAAAIDYVGPSNLFTFIESYGSIYGEKAINELHRCVGHPEKDKEMLRKFSPLFHVDNIVAPLFVAHGANDPRVKQAEADQIVEALRKKGVPVQYMLKGNEGHGFRNEENNIEFYNAMLTFLDKHLKK